MNLPWLVAGPAHRGTAMIDRAGVVAVAARDKARSDARGLKAVRNWIPLAGLVIGLGLLGTAVLTSRRRPAEQYADEG